MPLQGVANAAIFSRSLRSQWTLREGAARLFLFRQTTEPSIRLHRVSRAATGEIGLLEATAAAPVVVDEEEQRAAIFAATWNVGEANPPSPELLRQWLPPGRDAYFLGLQECLAPQAFASAIHTALGGSAAFQLVAEERIGSANTALGYHGFIVLFVFISVRAAESGAWSRVLASDAAVKRGKKIGAGAMAAHASNKGAVGAAFRFHTTTLSVVAAHLAADKKGKKNVRARLTDMRMLLEGLELEYDDLELDLQLSCHHVILLGDLNFRVDLPAETAVDHLARRELLPLLAADELLTALQSGEALHGFREAATPTFLPSFRRIPGEVGRVVDEELAPDTSLGADRVRQLYSLAASDGTERTPSYTDRVLLHSLPDMRPSLVCTCYTASEQLTVSDHRPVVADLELLARPTQLSTARCELTLRDLRFAAAKPRLSGAQKAARVPQVEALQILLPLPCEQTAFALERVNALSGVIGARPSVAQASVNSKFVWAKVSQGAEGVSVAASNLEAARVHAALRLIGANGEECGQGVLAITPTAAPPVPSEDYAAAGDDAEANVAYTDAQLRPLAVELSVQGHLVGVLHGVCSASWA